MWIDTGELVRLLEKVDEAEAILRGADENATWDDFGEVLEELRKLIYRDIALADNPSLADGKAGGEDGKRYRMQGGRQ